MANEFIARKGLKILEISEENTTSGSIPFVGTDGTVKKISTTNFFNENNSQILNTTLSGFTATTNTTILSTDNVLQAFGKTQGQINARVSGTGTSGQVSFWNGTSSQTGSNNLFWDDVNGRLGIGTNSPATIFQTIVGNSDFRFSQGTSNITPTICAINTNSNSKAVAILAGTIGSAFAYDNSGYFAIQSETKSSFNNNILGNGTVRLVVQSNGNVGIGVGSTDAGFRLDVNGTTRLNGLQTFQGTTASDTAPLGSELATTGSGTNWTGTGFATGYTHAVGSTAPLTTSTPAVSGTYYQIAYTVTGRTAGSFTINYGGTSTAGLTATGATGPLASSTANLEIVPTTDFDGTIVLSVRSIGISSATTTINDSGGNSRIQIRATTASSNTLIGLNSGRRITTGGNNSFFGLNAGLNNTTGVSNSFFGLQAGFNNTTGVSNSFVGVNAGFNNTTGGNNSFVGVNAGLNNTTGGNNSFVGVNAGRFLANGSTALTIANSSVFLGVDTRANADNETNQIVIGYQAIGLGSNTTVIGNSSTTFGRWWGNLLIGTSTNAGFALDVAGSTRIVPPADTTGLTLSGYSLTGSSVVPAIDISGTWNTTGTPTLIRANVTDTDSNSLSWLMSLQVGGVQRLGFRKDGFLQIGSSTSKPAIGGVSPTNFGGQANADAIFIGRGVINGAGYGILLGAVSGTRTPTSGQSGHVRINETFNPTSGTGVYDVLTINNTINQTGGANGITRGLYVNPNLTSAADWRSIEWSNNTGWGLYGAGTANNYLNGSLGIGTTITGTIGNLVISRNITGGVTASNVRSSGIIQSDVTNSARYFTTDASSVGTLNNLIHYLTLQSSLGTVTNQYGFFANSLLTGATNNFGFYGDIASGTGRWNLYMNGTANNYLRGNLLLNTITDAGFGLDVNGTARVQGVLSASSGTLDNPGIYFGTDTNTGLYRPSENVLGISAGGISWLFDSGSFSSGNIYIRRNFGLSASTPDYSWVGYTSTGIFRATGVHEIGISCNGSEVARFVNGGSVLIGTTTNISSSILTISSTTKGFLPPRMTTAQRDAIATPAQGLQIFNTTTAKTETYDGTTWQAHW
jgi:hypothetical protein